MKKVVFLMSASLVFNACTSNSGGNGDTKNSPNIPSPGQHKLAECPNLVGQFRLKTDARVIAKIDRNTAGNLVLVFDTSDPLVVDGTLQTARDGSSAIGICSQNMIIVNGKSDGKENAGTIRPTGTGFIIEITKPEQQSAEYIR